MRKLSIPQLIEFRKKSAKSKKTFVEYFKSNKIEIPVEGGGNYWITSLSAICNSYRHDNLNLIDEKIIELQDKFGGTKYSNSKNMYQRNIAILESYKKMDLEKIRPTENLSFLRKSTGDPLLTINGLQVEAKPSHIFSFGIKEAESIGAIWFTAKVKGYSVEEVGMYCDMLHRFLKTNYAKKYQLMPKYCVAVDMVSGIKIDYSEIIDGSRSSVLIPTLLELGKLM